ncbi:MAG: DUF1566 domain-containing protein [Candidatus Marinarcus sp.]|uniref:Lcl C-terminal domain-containing protein n=1 Tax=Candidatus Marinarcus sp. TaxID=3100987 RepID=UPI003B000138
MKYFLSVLFLTTILQAAMNRNPSLEVVVDTQNRLMWMDNKENILKQMSHKEAEPYCENLRYGGYTNWRLPTLEEFETIVDKQNFKTYIHKAFKYNVPTGYWAIKAHFRTLWFYADYMNFVSGTAYFDNRNVNKYVRCVRTIK